MDIQLPTQEEISLAYQQGEKATLVLFSQVSIQVLSLAKQLEEQATAVKELQAKLAKNSSNSGKPPSSDGYAKKNTVKRTESQRKKGQNSSGGQKGHKGTTLKKSNKSDHVNIHTTHENCKNCGHSLNNVGVTDHEERQVFDIPAIRIEITAHKAEIKICSKCKVKNKGHFPDEVTQPTQYGTGVKTLAGYFSTQHFIPVARTAQIIEDLFDQRISQASIIKYTRQLSEKISLSTESIKQQLQQSKVVNFDESGVRVNSKLHWLHSASTDKLTDYHLHQKRSKLAMDDANILINFNGIACHDHWKPYFNYENISHSLCNAHHLRELTFLEKQYNQTFAPKMANLLTIINKDKHKLQEKEQNCFTEKQLEEYTQTYDHIVQEGLDANPEKFPDPNKKPKRGKIKQTPAFNMLRRLSDFKTAVLMFMNDFDVPFTNNQAEQDVRMIKVKQKVSGCFRTFEGGEEFVKNRGYISTVRKHGESVFGAVKSAFENSPFIPQAP